MRRASQALDNNIGLLTRTRASGPASLLGGYRGVGTGRRLPPLSPSWGSRRPQEEPTHHLAFPQILEKSSQAGFASSQNAPRMAGEVTELCLRTTLGLVGALNGKMWGEMQGNEAWW